MTGFIYGEPLGTNEATTMNEMEQKAERYFRKCLADNVHNYEEEDNWFSIEGSYRDVRAEQKHLIQVNMSA
jgi:thioredoxin reductase